MSSKYEYELDLHSDKFRVLCNKLNMTLCKEGATWTADIFSGGFKFSDEFPEGLNEPEMIDLALSVTTLLRRLWTYRMSLIEGKPRSDLAVTWESTMTLAPRWAGFTPERCSPRMQSIVDGVRSKKTQFAEDVDRLEARIEEEGNRKRASSTM